jgi:urate oxidase
MATLEYNHYGKEMVRLLRVRREGTEHSVSEWEVSVTVEGGQKAAYLSDDNSCVLPSDSMKNIIHALAYDLGDASRDDFALALGRYFLEHYPRLSGSHVEVWEKTWNRMIFDGRPHSHGFVRDANGEFFSRVLLQRDEDEARTGGVRDFTILKTTEAGFSGFLKDGFTTLAETDDRILCTSIDAEWDYYGEADGADRAVVDAMLRVFASTYSPSLQRTLYLMGEAVLAACSGISRVRLSLPNRHYLNLDLSKFGRPGDQRKVFLPTEEPVGLVEATVARTLKELRAS